MSLIKRSELPALLADREQLALCHIYLFFGERYLCREAADQLQQALFAGCAGAVHPIDGDQEDSGQTLSRLMSFSLLPGRQIYRVTDSRIFVSKTVAAPIWDKAVQNAEAGKPAAAMRHLTALAQLAELSPESQTAFSAISADQWQQLFAFAKPGGDLAWADRLLVEAVGTGKASGSAPQRVDQYINAFTKGLPQQNYLILTAEAVDKRQRLFSYIKKSGVAVDCSVATGSASAVQKEQKEVLREMVLKTLGGLQKKIDGRALDLFFDRVGFHPVAVVVESEKLALYVGDRPQITTQDIEAMVTRTREDALYELTDAFGKGLVSQSLILLTRLQENGTHALAILATLRNYLRRLLIFRSLQSRSEPRWQSGMTAQQFQNSYLPAIKATGEWPDLLQGHPYALYMSFTKAAEYSCTRLQHNLDLLLAAEYRLKGSSLPQHIVLEELFLSMLKQKR